MLLRLFLILPVNLLCSSAECKNSLFCRRLMFVLVTIFIYQLSLFYQQKLHSLMIS